MSLENNSHTFRKKPVALIKSLRIPNLEKYVYENISSFIRDVFIHSEENDLIPDFLNSTFVDWDDAKYRTESMSFVLTDDRQKLALLMQCGNWLSSWEIVDLSGRRNLLTLIHVFV